MAEQINVMAIAAAAIFAIASFAIGYALRKWTAEKKVDTAEKKAKEILDKAQKEAEHKRRETEIEGKDLRFKIRQEFEEETKGRRQEMLELEKRLSRSQENLDKKVDILDRKEKDVTQRETTIANKEKHLETSQRELNSLLAEERQMLQRVSSMSAQDAKNLLMERMKKEAQQQAALTIKKIEDEAKLTAEKKSKQVIGMAIQRFSAEHTVETTVSVVHLPSDEMKGRIIGREGRNIRALEIATGVDVIIDDTPGAVTLSGFDPIRRDIARISLERLIHDGRIHPGRIEEVVEKVKGEMENSIREEGEKATFDVGVHNLHPELVRLLGRLKYRTSYGQNVLQHSKEVAYIMGVMASELELDFRLARHIGLLHDIGKAVSHEVEGTHIQIGVDLLKKYGESQEVINAVEAHHQDVEAKSLYGVLIQAADAISATRPGARRETLETYIKRLDKLEAIADSFKGVDKAYAIQAGREIRVIVQPNKIRDEQAITMSKEIAKKIEEGLEYPGQIKVTVVRETRSIEYAK